jgi:hypothetical protein
MRVMVITEMNADENLTEYEAIQRAGSFMSSVNST